MNNILPLLFSPQLLPAVLLSLMGFVILLLGPYGLLSRMAHLLSLIGLLLTLLLVLGGPNNGAAIPLLSFDPFIAYGFGIILFSAWVIFQLSGRYWQMTRLFRFEVASLLLWSLAGLLLMVAASNFLMLYLGLELSSLCFYFLVNLDRDNKKSSEAALKYYILGSTASALLLFGISLIYGMVGSVDFATIKATTQQLTSSGQTTTLLSLALGLLFVIVGLGFKIAAAPFHLWAPDVYEGAPTPITAFFATAPKLAGVIILARLLLQYFDNLADWWRPLLVILALLSLVLGAFPALIQNNFKRFIAIAGITHVGFLLLAMVALVGGTERDLAPLSGYLFVYLSQTIGLMALLLGLIKQYKKAPRTKAKNKNDNQPVAEEDLLLSDFAGLASYRPRLAFGLLLLLFSLVGIPPLLGFFAKWWVVIALVQHGLSPLAVVAVLVGLVSATYYLKIIKTIYMDKPPQDFMLVNRSIYDGQQNRLMQFWLGLMVLIQLVAPLFLGSMLNWLRHYNP